MKLSILAKKSKLFGILTIAIILTLVVGLVAATATMNPRVTYSGYGNPDNSTGREGDLYVETDTNVLWIFKGDAWEMFAIFPEVVNGTDGPIGPTGPQGPQGEPGPIGPQGEQGPAGVDGINGTNGIDGKDGIDGIDGADGKNGTQIFNELMYTCADSLGNNGDFFLFANGTLNVKIDGSWVLYGSLIGPRGSQGEGGPTGPQGEQGPIGPVGQAGADGVNGTDGIDGSYSPEGIPDDSKELEILWWIILVLAVVSGLAMAFSVYAVRKYRRK